MRICADEFSSNHWALHFKAPVRVFLDDVEIRDVRECDDEEGWAEVYVLDESGFVVAEGDEAKRQTLAGRIRIVAEPRV